MSGPFSWFRTAWDFVFDVGKRWYYGGIGDLAAGVTFWILLTLPAAVLAMVSGLSVLDAFVGQSLQAEIEGDLVRFVERILSDDAEVIRNAILQLFDQQNGGLLVVSVAFTLFTISRGFAGMMRALDKVYEVEEGRPWWVVRIVGLVLGLGSLLVSVPIVLLEIFVWGQIVTGGWETALRLVSAILILVSWASIFYHYGPSIRAKYRWDLPGALVAAVFWWLLTISFQNYISLVNGRNEVLSTIGAFLLALTWVWLAAQVLLIGAAVNSILGDRFKAGRSRKQWNLPAKIFQTGQIPRIDIDEAPEPDGRPTGLPRSAEAPVR